jgi:UDP-N-acetylmuramoyl-L-alanyl-D-glutamate--2,6-diaminopimelate ligase
LAKIAAWVADSCGAGSRLLRPGQAWIHTLALDSRRVTPGALFFAIPGTDCDGARFAAPAVGNGAVAVVANRPLTVPVPVLVTDDVRHAAAVVAKQFYRDPSAVIPVVGVTGTNGKTSVATMLHRILGDNGVPNGLLATTGYRVGQRRLPAPNTTPNALDLQAYLREMVEQRQQAAIMEVSSHALDQQRVRGVEFACAVITNLTQDHLDYHGDMERYRAAKLRLFQSLQPEAAAVVPVDDEVGRHAAEACGDGVRIVRFGLEQPAEFSGRIHAMTLHQTVLDLETPNGSVRITLPLSGLHNVRNALAAAAAASSLGVGTLANATGLEQMVAPPGRLEAVQRQPFAVFVDYAHTADALHHVCRTLRQHTAGRLLVLFGCGGDRDRGKRPDMGRTVAAFADLPVITNDNPRREDPDAILDDIERGYWQANRRGELIREPDRRAAIGRVLSLAAVGDVVLLAGKGHETGQQIGSTIHPFDDRAVAEEWLCIR